MNDRIKNLKDSLDRLLEDYEIMSRENEEMKEVFEKISNFMHPKAQKTHSWVEKERNLTYILYLDQNNPDYEYREYSNGARYWLKNGEYHRDGDEPAIIYPNGTKYWYKNGKRHRDGDEPAIIRPNGSKEWYKNGKFVKS